ncbi:uncharacterized protein LOC113239588 [Hyposmocoma kahamanoa]|uniref:uncharacterized protein LOC113239588 n=1 Tax=Hyposmocoma kahamanoa TaxID=1477025 RepID=UPI000E6D8986|nr:uncharacterized protein LOC113239588 [Hyposmocoma kahamanoa]
MISSDQGESSKYLQIKQLKELIVKRSSIKGQITKFRNYLESFEGSTRFEAIDIAKLTVKLGKFECLSSKFDELQVQIEILNSENLGTELDERECVEQGIIDCIAAAKMILNMQHDASLQEERDRRNSFWQDAQGDGQDVGIKLPQIQISKFDGSYFRCVTLSCLVLEELTGYLPKQTINLQNIKLPKDIQLADPTFDRPSPVQVLIGADIFWDILGLHNCSSKESDIENLLTKFWDLEDIPQKTVLSEEEAACERHFIANVTRLNSGLKINRSGLCESPTTIEMHSFSDASLSGYGACIYVKSSNSNGDVTVRLLCAKSKVTCLKPTTIPRLELCAALLAARLSNSVINSVRYKFDRIVHWCDSSVVLAWLRGSPTKLKTFVANRVGEILDTTQPSSWRYVPTASNPADLISRGASPNQLCNSELWWNGPTFLIQNESKWPILNSKDVDQNIPEIKITATTVSSKLEQVIIFENYSKLTKLQRIMAYVKRFIYNSKNPKNKRLDILSTNELNDAMKSLFYLAQMQVFAQERVVLSKKTPLSPKSRILPLNPFLDSDNLIRVGGRLSASDYSYDKIHPLLLDSSHHLTKLIFEHEHLRNLHAGPQLLLATVRESVWPLKGRQLARRTVYNCVRCRRVQGKTLLPKMGDLPSQRITPDFPFRSVGLDFAGPFITLNRKGRGAKLVKSYLCLFVCLRYKCIHIEAVSDLSKDAFVMTLRRFVARRGRPVEIFCDNGRNFVAAAKELGSFLQSNSGPMSEFASQEGFKFIFSPAYAPHFGGIWEAGVKSAKYHIKRVMGNTHLTFEELTTLFAQVEAILNSRPLCPLSSCPHDFLFLSPGHFIIGRPLNALPAPDLNDHKETGLNRFSRLEQVRQHFWVRWQKEYISELQLRTKWRTNKSNLNVGDLVLLQEDFVPPLSWRLGRVMRLFPGSDGVSRVADINTTRGCIRRPLVRLCPLPTAEDMKS